MSDDEKEKFIKFCNLFLLKAMKNSRKRFLRNEKKKISECILNRKNSDEVEFIDFIPGEEDVNIDEFLSIADLLEDNILFLAYMSLSAKEKEIVDYRLKGYNYSEINQILGYKRQTTSCEIYNRALRKMRKEYLRRGGKNNEKKQSEL